MRLASARRFALGLTLLTVAGAALAGCGSSSGGAVTVPKIAAARVFTLGGFTPTGSIQPGHATTMSFTVKLPSGKPLTTYRTGAGPHTGVHLIIVRDDLAYIIHDHPPISPSGLLSQRVTFPAPGPYRVLVDIYPNLPGGQPNFQLFASVTVRGQLPGAAAACIPRPRGRRRLPLRHDGQAPSARHPGRLRTHRGDRSARPPGQVRAVVRGAGPRHLLSCRLAGLLPHPRLRRWRAELLEHPRRPPGSPAMPPPLATSRWAFCCPSPARGGCFCRCGSTATS